MSDILQPYPGIRPFEEKDWPIFFGRETQANQLLHKLETNRFAAVVGSSGSGKSSLVKAGLIPLVRQGYLRNVTDWATIVCRPGLDPFAGLAAQISLLDGNADPKADPEEPESVTSSLIGAELRISREGIIPILKTLKLAETHHFLVIVDQFEEIFSFRSLSGGASSTSRGEAQRFVDCLLQSCAAPVFSPLKPESAGLSQRVWVILTMRSDFIGHCEIFPALAQAVSDSQFLVPVLDSEQKKEAITRPGQAGEIDGATYHPFGFDDGVVSIIVNETGDRLDQLPLMQHGLMRTWKLAKERVHKATTPIRITLDNYQEAGRIEQALHNDAETAWKEISSDPKLAGIGQQMFMLLCDISEEGKLTRRRPKVSAVIQATGAGLADLESIIKVFQKDDRNFLLPSLVSPEKHRLDLEDALDISHEALLRQWRTYRDWQDEERRNVDELTDLKKRSSRYFDAGKKEDPLSERALERVRAWREKVTESWATRYVLPDEWKAIDVFIEKSQAVMLENQDQAIISARRAAERERRLKRWATVGIIAGIVVAGMALALAFRAVQNATEVVKYAAAREREAEVVRVSAVRAQTQRFLVTIGSSDVESEGLSSDERLALWDAAELLPASEEVRTRLVEEWLSDVTASRKAFRNGGIGLKAVIGTSGKRRKHGGEKAVALVDRILDKKEGDLPEREFWLGVAEVLNSKERLEIAGRLSAALENGEKATPERLSILGEALVAVTQRAGDESGASLATRGAHILAMAFNDPQEVQLERLETLGQALVSLAPHLTGEDIAALAERLVTLVENPGQIQGRGNTSNLEGLSKALASQMNGNDVVLLAERITKLLENSQEPQGRAWTPGKALAAFAPRLEEKDAAPLAERLAKTLENPKTKGERLWILSEALAALLERLDATNASRVASRGAHVLITAMERSQKSEPNTLRSLGYALARLLTHTDANTAATFAAQGAQMIFDIRSKILLQGARYELLLYDQVLFRLATRMDGKEARVLAEGLANALEDSAETELGRRVELSRALVAIAPRVDATTAAALTERIAKALENPQETDAARLSILNMTLGALAPRLDGKTATALAERMAKTLENPRDTHPKRLSILEETLGVLTFRLDGKNAARLAERMAKELESRQAAQPDCLATLSGALATLTLHAEGDVALALATRGAQVLVRVLENPQAIQPDRLPSLGCRLADLSSQIPEAKNMWRLALSYALLDKISEEPKNGQEVTRDRKSVVRVCALLSGRDAAEILKWPFCVGEAEQILLAALEKKTGVTFDGDVWRFVEQAEKLGITNLDEPAQRPQAEDTISEFQNIRKPLSKP